MEREKGDVIVSKKRGKYTKIDLLLEISPAAPWVMDKKRDIAKREKRQISLHR